jgi:hypothetical protein
MYELDECMSVIHPRQDERAYVHMLNMTDGYGYGRLKYMYMGEGGSCNRI